MKDNYPLAPCVIHAEVSTSVCGELQKMMMTETTNKLDPLKGLTRLLTRW